MYFIFDNVDFFHFNYSTNKLQNVRYGIFCAFLYVIMKLEYNIILRIVFAFYE